MRKYFLLSAVALLTATTANATTDYAEVTAKATIEVASVFSCSDLNFGKIVVKNGHEDTYVVLGYEVEYDKENIISFSEYEMAACNNLLEVTGNDSIMLDHATLPETITLSGPNGSKLTVSDYQIFDWDFGGKLNIPAGIQAGEYTGSFTVTVTY
ncbi:MAG: DUF4402 domain-containing protein [Alphaproteobacteria bacterium]|nr:DUF4402 domain-containing protein [Alphaproteobacteria bacterium]MBQ2811372.1 DUF4402 domain-containing protein [Alphaproteobacteria bacterium]